MHLKEPLCPGSVLAVCRVPDSSVPVVASNTRKPRSHRHELLSCVSLARGPSDRLLHRRPLLRLCLHPVETAASHKEEETSGAPARGNQFPFRMYAGILCIMSMTNAMCSRLWKAMVPSSKKFPGELVRCKQSIQYETLKRPVPILVNIT